MFRDLKEYQKLQKLYEKVSNDEEIKKEKNKALNVDNNNNNNNNKNNNNNNTEKPKYKKVTQKQLDDKISEINKAGGIKPFLKNNKKKTDDFKVTVGGNGKKNETSTKINKGISDADREEARIESGYYEKPESPYRKRETGADRAKELAKKRIGTGTARNPETTIAQAKQRNKDIIKDRAIKRNDAFKQRQQEFRDKKRLGKPVGKPQPKVLSPMDMRNESYEPYDIVLEYLLSTQQAATIEEANYVMTEMDAKTIQDIVSQQQLTEKNLIQKFINPDKKKIGNQDKPLPIYMRKGRQQNNMPL